MIRSFRSAAAGLLFFPSAVFGELSANVGFVSDYIFRGVPQNDSSVSAGLDFEHRGCYAGTWGADVGQGAEVDGYLGYRNSLGQVSYGIGATGYFYTDDFDDTYKELNLNLGYRLLSLDVAFGEYDNFSGPTLDYRFVSLGFEYQGFSAALGSFGDDFDGEYVELSYGWGLQELDLSIGVIHSNSDLLGDSETSLILSIGKGFTIRD